MFFDEILRYLRQRKIIKLIPSNSLICDFGCGENFNFLKKISKNINYGWGFDKNAFKKKDDNIEIKKLDLEKEKIPLGDNLIDRIIMSAVLEHLNNPIQILKEAFRILKPAGFLILTTPSKLSKPILDFLAFKLNLIKKQDILEHKKYYSPEEIKKLLFNSGFKKIKIKKFEFGLNTLAIAEK